jgi:hypothetical protein
MRIFDALLLHEEKVAFLDSLALATLYTLREELLKANDYA